MYYMIIYTMRHTIICVSVQVLELASSTVMQGRYQMGVRSPMVALSLMSEQSLKVLQILTACQTRKAAQMLRDEQMQ